jgi:hypothetical protein
MASATNISDGQTPRGDAAVVYSQRDNIVVPGADQTDPAVGASGTVASRAATRETERNTSSAGASPKLQLVGATGVNYAPDQADNFPAGSERSAP